MKNLHPKFSSQAMRNLKKKKSNFETTRKNRNASE